MEMRQAFGRALRRLRLQRELTQEHFKGASSRTYLSTLERGQKCPTLDKIIDLAMILDVHPLTLLAGAFLELDDEETIENLAAKILDENRSLGRTGLAPIKPDTNSPLN